MTTSSNLRRCPECGQTGVGTVCHHWDAAGERKILTVPPPEAARPVLMTASSLDGFAAAFGQGRSPNARPAPALWHLETDERDEWRLAEDGPLHREDGPALTVRMLASRLVRVEYRCFGKLHRLDGPATATVPDDSGLPPQDDWGEVWYVNGMVHRDGGPALILCKPDGGRIEEWVSHGQVHREDGPAHIQYGADGQVLREEWFEHDKLHRFYGPAVVRRTSNGRQIAQSFRNGKAVPDGLTVTFESAAA